MKQKVAHIIEERTRIIAKLEQIHQIEKVFPTDANFLIFRVQDAYSIYQTLAGKGVVVRYRGNEHHCENCLRLTIGTTAENDRFLEALDEILNRE